MFPLKGEGKNIDKRSKRYISHKRYECVCVLWNNTTVCVISSITQRKKIYFCPTLFFSFKTYLNKLTVQILDLLRCPESISCFFFYIDLSSDHTHRWDLIFLFYDSTFFYFSE